MESFIVAVMMFRFVLYVSVLVVETIIEEEGNEVGGKLDVGNAQGLFVGSTVKEMDTGLL